MKRASRSVLTAVVSIVFGASLMVACGASGDDGGAAVDVVDIPLTDLEGRPTTLGEIGGSQRVLVSLWAVWCQPCRRELPVLDQIAAEHPDLAVVAVNIGDEVSAITSFVDELSLATDVVVDRDGDMLSELDAPTVPVTFVLDANGRVLWKHVGAVDSADVRAAIEQVD
jgi:thiol-disulfide isomerase/thioredoxin